MSIDSQNKRLASFMTALKERFQPPGQQHFIALLARPWIDSVQLVDSSAICETALTSEERAVLSSSLRDLMEDDTYFTDLRDYRRCESLLARLSA